MFMEYARGGTLYNFLKKWGPFPEAAGRAPFRQLLSAVHYCHQKHIVHRDIKPENILVDMGLNIKLADFGLSAVFMEEKLSTFCGTPNYKAPELFRLEPYEGPKVDVWSMGVVLYEMLTGVRPFVGKTLEQLEEHILSGEFSIPSSLSIPCHALLRRMIDIDPDRRPNLGIIMKDDWVNIGEAQEMTPYIEPACTDIDPQVTEIMRTLGYEQEEIESSLMENKFNSVMGTYRILNMKFTTGIQTIKVISMSSEGTWGSETKGRDPRNPPPSPEFSVPTTTPPGGLDWSHPWSMSMRAMASPPIRVEVKRVMRPCNEHLHNISQAGSEHFHNTSQHASEKLESTSQPDTRGELRKQKLKPELQGDSHVLPATRGSSSPRSCSGGTEITTNKGQARPSCEETRASSPEHSQCRKGMARRILEFLKRCCCCTGKTKKPRVKITRVVPL